MSSDQARKVKATCKVNGESRYLTYFEASASIGAGSWPRVRVVTHPKKEAYKQSVKLTAKDVTGEMEKRQKKVFSARSKPDVTISISVEGDSKAGTFSFKGFTVGPSYSFSVNGVQLCDDCLPEYAKVEALDYSIYSEPSDLRDKNSQMVSLEDAGTILKCLKQIAQEYMDNVSEREPKITERLGYAKKHAYNKKVKKYFEQLLQDSEGEKKFGWTKVQEMLKLNGSEVDDERLINALCSALTSNYGGFSTVLSSIEELFQVVYIPKWEEIGYFKNYNRIFKQANTLKLDIVGLDIRTTNGFGLFPMAYMTVVPCNNFGDLREGEGSKEFVVVPEENIGRITGMQGTSSGPSWVNFTSFVESDIDDNSEEDEVDFADPGDADVECKDVIKALQSIDKTAKELLKEWGKCEFIRQSLVGSVATVTTPLTFKPKLGYRYKVQSDDGPLFEGVLASVRHVVSTDGNSPQAYSTLTFKWVTCGSFKLPGTQ